MASSISSAVTNLYTLLGAHAGLTGIQVVFGPPAAYEEQEVVAILGLLDPDEDHAALGPLAKREERYSIEVGVKAHKPDAATGLEVAQRVLVLADEVRSVVRTNHTLTNAVRNAEVISQTSQGDSLALPAEGGGWVSFIRLLIACEQRID